MGSAYFFGVQAGHEAGHYCWMPGGWRPLHNNPKSPWGTELEPLTEELALPAAWGHQDSWQGEANQPEGVARVVYKDGWTLLSCWDRSGDVRGNSHATFAFDEVLTPNLALERARSLFAHVWDRIDAHLEKKGSGWFRVEHIEEV